MLKSLKNRSFEKEKMDGDHFSYEDLKDCLLDIEKINRWTRAHHSTLKFVDRLYQKHKLETDRPLKIVDIGFGSGDLLRQLEHMAQKKGYHFELIGVELHPWSVKIARDLNKKQSCIHFEEKNVFDFTEPVDIFVCSLVLHHLSDKEIQNLVLKISQLSQLGWFFHDLKRHIVPYGFIWGATRLMRLHEMVQSDAPLSVARGFNGEELKLLFDRVPGFHVKVNSEFPFKWSIVAERESI